MRRTSGRLAPLALVSVLGGGPGCATMLVESKHERSTVHFGGTIVDLVGCCLILPLPLCLPDLPLSFLADLVIWLVDDEEYREEHPRPGEVPAAEGAALAVAPEVDGGG